MAFQVLFGNNKSIIAINYTTHTRTLYQSSRPMYTNLITAAVTHRYVFYLYNRMLRRRKHSYQYYTSAIVRRHIYHIYIQTDDTWNIWTLCPSNSNTRRAKTSHNNVYTIRPCDRKDKINWRRPIKCSRTECFMRSSRTLDSDLTHSTDSIDWLRISFYIYLYLTRCVLW